MKIKNESLNFHETFQPQRIYLAHILKLAANMFEGSKEDISEATGIPTGDSSGKVVPHIKYCKYMGLVDYKINNNIYSLELTELGDVIYNEDSMLTSNITKLLCHYNMCDFIQGAPQWIYLFRYFSNSNMRTDKEIVTKHAYKTFEKNIDFGIINKIYNKKLDEDNILGGIVLKVEKGDYIFEPVQYSFEEIFVYAYALLDSWDKYFENNSQITLESLIDEIKWNNIFGIDQEHVLDILDELEEFGVVVVNKQMTPIVLQRLESKKNILDRIYEFSV